MSINVKVYDNGDHTALVWLPSDTKPIPGCLGFTVRRVIQGSPDTYLHGFTGFSDTDKLDPNAPWKHPVQRFMWWDYGVSPGQVVQYSVVPVTGDQNHLELATNLQHGIPVSSPVFDGAREEDIVGMLRRSKAGGNQQYENQSSYHADSLTL